MSEFQIVIQSFLPIYILLFGAALLLIFDWLLGKKPIHKQLMPSTSIITLIVAAYAVFIRPRDPSKFPGNPQLFYFGEFYAYFAMLALTAAFVVVLSAWKDMELELSIGVFYALLLIATAGILIIGAAENFIPLYVGFEVLSISTYAMIGFKKKSRSAAEASIKYFLLGALASGILLFGISLFYGAAHSLQLSAGKNVLNTLGTNTPNAYGLFVMALLVVGVGFKIAAVPFHVWVPDVYKGSSLSVTNFLAIGSKAGGFAFVFKVFLLSLITIKEGWAPVWAVLAVLTMVVGNLAALPQVSVTRILAYSSIAHVGYILIALVAYAHGATQMATIGALYHLTANIFMKGTAFTVVLIVVSRTGGDTLEHFKGLSKKDPWTAFFMAIALLSLAGIPPFAGFFGKFFLFYSAYLAGDLYLAIIAITMSAVSVFYYARIIYVMYFHEPVKEVESQQERKYPNYVVLLFALTIGNIALFFGAIFLTPQLVAFGGKVAEELSKFLI